MRASEDDGSGRLGGPPFKDATIYTVEGQCYRCGGPAMVSQHYGPWCMVHNIERIERIDAGFAAIEARFAQLGGAKK